MIFWGILLSILWGQDLVIKPFAKDVGLPMYFQDAMALEFKRPDGLILKGAVLGPETGSPILLSPGYFGSAGYMSEVAYQLAAKGFRVYTYSLRGKGQGVLRSNFSRPRQDYDGQFGFEEMVRDKEALIEAIHKLHGMPVGLMAHSLSGLIVRVIAAGIDLHPEQHTSQKAKRLAFQEKVAFAVVLKSPSPVMAEPERYGISVDAAEIKQMETAMRFITQIFPTVAAINNSGVAKALKYSANVLPMKDLVVWAGLRFADLMMAPVAHSSDFNGARRFEALMTANAERIEPDIIRDLRRFHHHGFITSQGYNIAKTYLNPKTVSERFPIVLVSGESDILAPIKFTQVESEVLGLKHIRFGDSHMSGLFGTASTELTKIFLKGYNVAASCRGIF